MRTSFNVVSSVNYWEIIKSIWPLSRAVYISHLMRRLQEGTDAPERREGVRHGRPSLRMAAFN